MNLAAKYCLQKKSWKRKLSSAFDKFEILGLGSKYIEGIAFQHSERKKKCNVTGDSQITVTAVIAIFNQAGGKKLSTVN